MSAPSTGLTGVYDTDTVIFAKMDAKALARCLSVSPKVKASVERYVKYLVSSGKLKYKSALTAGIEGALNTLTVSQVLKKWHEGKLNKS